jgi:transcription antitermination protein NusB
MSLHRDVRRCAIQAMYQFDFGHADSAEVVRESLRDSPGSDESREKGFELALGAWEHHADADAVISELSPDWPVYRQPVIDRNILRLAHYEMMHTSTPPKVTINEAVELAREFSTERSPAFINGVLDRIYRRLRKSAEEIEGAEEENQVKEGRGQE